MHARLIPLALGLLVAAGCDADSNARGGPGGACADAKCDEVEGETDGEELAEHPEHREAVLACEQAADRVTERTHAQRFDALAAIADDRAACLQRANDEILPAIDDIVMTRGSEIGALTAIVERYRTASGLLCPMLADASDEALTKAGSVALVSCGAQSESDLAALIGAQVDLGEPAIAIVPSRVRYPECWDTFDGANADAAVASQTLAASESLLECIDAANEGVRATLVGMIMEQFPGRATETLEQDSERALRSHANATEDLCEGLSIAGHSVASGDVELSWLQCRVAAVSMVGHLGDLVVPGAWPEGSEADEDQADEDVGGSTGE